MMKKFSSLLVVLLLMLASFTANAQEYPRGDVDKDGQVDIADVTYLIDNVLQGVMEGDVDKDGQVDISDVTVLINYILNDTWPDDPVTPPDNHEYVDLGLPSGTLWATCNVGANAPEEYGDHFAWGEIEPKNYYSQYNYKWGNGSDDFLMTKYCTDNQYGYNGFTDGKTELDPEDDAAYVNCGTLWRMPTWEQWQELKDECAWTMTSCNGVNGELVTGPNGNTIFLPAAGDFGYGRLTRQGSWGFYWSRTLISGWDNHAFELFFNTEYISRGNDLRFWGFSVRPVRVSQN